MKSSHSNAVFSRLKYIFRRYLDSGRQNLQIRVTYINFSNPDIIKVILKLTLILLRLNYIDGTSTSHNEMCCSLNRDWLIEKLAKLSKFLVRIRIVASSFLLEMVKLFAQVSSLETILVNTTCTREDFLISERYRVSNCKVYNFDWLLQG